MNLATKAQFKASSFIYLLPFIIYLITLTPVFRIFENKFFSLIGKILNPSGTRLLKIHLFSKEITIDPYSRSFISLFLILTGVLVDILFIKQSDMTMIILFFLTYFAVRFYRISESVLIIYATFSILSSAAFYYLNLNPLSEKAAAWGWLYLFLLVILLLSSNNKKSKRLISSK